MPLVWYTDGPNISQGQSDRQTLYNVGGLPHTTFVGTNNHIGGVPVGTMYEPFLEIYQNHINDVSPMKIDVELSINENSQYLITTTVEITGEFTNANNRIYFIISIDGPGFPRFLVGRSAFQNFYQTEVGSIQTYTQALDMNSIWSHRNIRAISFVQSMNTPRRILQANYTQLAGTFPAFVATLTQGPPSLTTAFTDLSFSTYPIIAREWDFNNDGIIDSTASAATWTYETPGTYSVALTIETVHGKETIVYEDYITVLEPNNVFGTVAGNWKKEFSPYIITGDVTIPQFYSVTIEPGVEIIVREGKGINVLGSLFTNGEKGNEIIFTSETEWAGITLNNVPGSNNSFYHTIFENALDSAITTNMPELIIEDCVFRNNRSTTSTGAALTLTNVQDAVIKRSFFVNNHATNSSGAINLLTSSLRLENSVIVNNTGRSAGAINVGSNSSLNMINCTIYNNHNTLPMAGTITNTNASTTILNSIISGNAPISNLNGTLDITFTRIIGNDGLGNITDEPMFMNESSGIGHEITSTLSDWILAENSPCIDAGSPEISYIDIEDPDNPDMALFPARGSLRNDMGAFGGNGRPNIVSEKDNTELYPIKSLIIDAYPNPFNPNLVLNISTNDLINPMNVTIYNIRGQKVNEIMNKIPTSESFTLHWNGLDYSGNSISSGIYFIRASNQNEITVKKVIMMK